MKTVLKISHDHTTTTSIKNTTDAPSYLLKRFIESHSVVVDEMDMRRNPDMTFFFEVAFYRSTDEVRHLGHISFSGEIVSDNDVENVNLIEELLTETIK